MYEQLKPRSTRTNRYVAPSESGGRHINLPACPTHGKEQEHNRTTTGHDSDPIQGHMQCKGNQVLSRPDAYK